MEGKRDDIWDFVDEQLPLLPMADVERRSNSRDGESMLVYSHFFIFFLFLTINYSPGPIYNRKHCRPSPGVSIRG